MPVTEYLKALNAGRTPSMGRGQWPKVGAYTDRQKPILCESGYHLSRDTLDLLSWLDHDEIYVAASDSPPVIGDNKVVVSRARLVRKIKLWTPQTARLLAADFAEHALPAYEAFAPGDTRVRDAIEAARKYARGEIDQDAARSAARSAESAAWSARSAAWSAWSAAESAARSAEKQWQARRLAEVLGLADTPLDGSLRP